MQQSFKNPLVEASLHPLEPIPVPGEPRPDGADQTFNFNLAFDTKTSRFSINGVVYKTPTVPVLLQILSGARNAHDLLPKGSV